MSKKLLALYGLKYNPFSQEAPTSSLWITPRIEEFCWRIEHQIAEGGYALIHGEPGTGKSATLRILTERLKALRDTTTGILTRPQASVADFYRELGDLFGVTLTASNRWGGAKALRQKWQTHIENATYRPVLLIDEAQIMNPAALSELRMLASADLDSRNILTIVLAGDQRLLRKLESDELLPIASRIRCRIHCDTLQPAQLKACLNHLLQTAGNPRLMTPGIIDSLSEHALGNYRVLMNIANDLLCAALKREAEQIDEKLYFELFSIDPKPTKTRI
jgi:general secretion pathway protein A